MKKNLFVLGTACLLSLVACGGNNPSSNEEVSSQVEESSEIVTSYQMIQDNTFQNGICMDPANGNNPDTGWVPDNRWMNSVDLKLPVSTSSPSWLGAQHGDIYSLCDKYNKLTKEEPTYDEANGTYTFFDESKKLEFCPSEGSLYMELNASKEYQRPRKPKEQWCHLLLEQGFEKATKLSDVESVIFTLDLTMKKFEDHMDGKADSSVHATQFLMYLVIKSENDTDCNDWFWFGIPFFDNRYPNGIPESGLIDAGGAGATSKFIYGSETNEYIPGGLKLNETAYINVDIKPYLGQALIMAQTKFNTFTHSVLDDLTFQSMNIGFEIPGTYDCGMKLANFSLTANYKEGVIA